MKKNNRSMKGKKPGKKNSSSSKWGVEKNLRPGDIMPPHKEVTLNFIDSNPQISSSGQAFVIKSIRVNDLYDPDPSILTTGYAGFLELMTFYEFYRVDRVSIKWNVCNNEAFPLFVGFVFSQVNLNAIILNRQDAIDALENGIGTKVRILQRNSGGLSSTNLVRSIALKNLLGDPTLYEGDIAYTGTATASPVDQLWCNFIIVSPSSAFLPNGTIGALTLRSTARLFGRIILNDLFPKPLKSSVAKSKQDVRLPAKENNKEKISEPVSISDEGYAMLAKIEELEQSLLTLRVHMPITRQASLNNSNT